MGEYQKFSNHNFEIGFPTHLCKYGVFCCCFFHIIFVGCRKLENPLPPPGGSSTFFWPAAHTTGLHGNAEPPWVGGGVGRVRGSNPLHRVFPYFLGSKFSLQVIIPCMVLWWGGSTRPPHPAFPYLIAGFLGFQFKKLAKTFQPGWIWAFSPIFGRGNANAFFLFFFQFDTIFYK